MEITAIGGGRFDMPLTSNLPNLPAKKGSMLSAKLGGTRYYAATINAQPTDLLGAGRE